MKSQSPFDTNRHHCRLVSVAVFFLLTGLLTTFGAEITVDGAAEGRTFDGIGGVSAGASSRLLIDYPEPQRSELLDYLFTPGFGASFHHLKVEIGGEINSTDGTEPTHMRSRDDLDFTRGYEWWLMKEAKKRNPNIILDCLPWGAPRWIGNGKFHSQDMADYIANFIKGAKEVHGLDIEYTGGWNERPFDANWYKVLRRTLDERGLSNVRIVAADEYKDWQFVKELVADSELRRAVFALGSHYTDEPPPAAFDLKMPLWCTEGGGWSGDWNGSRYIAQEINRNYIKGKLTKTEIWSLVTCYYNILILADSGPMLAREPWSGHYEVQPALWAIAHTAQFTQPGWKYLESGASALLPNGGSVVTLKSTNGIDFSMIAETFDTAIAQKITVHVTNGLSRGPIRVWRTTQNEHFVQDGLINPDGSGTFEYWLQPEALYTFTSTTLGQKGLHVPPPPLPFPLPFVDDFESYTLGSTPKYFSDQAGTFEVGQHSNGAGKSLKQIVAVEGLAWNPQFTPFTIIGENTWTDYQIVADARLTGDGFVSLMGRIENDTELVPLGYFLKIFATGRYELWRSSELLRSGPASFASNEWHQIRMDLEDSQIRTFLDGTLLCEVVDTRYATGLAGLGTGWHPGEFDNVRISQLHGNRNILFDGQLAGSTVYASNSADRAADDQLGLGWVSYSGTNQWLEGTFPRDMAARRFVIWEGYERITSWRFQAWDGDHWKDLVVGGPFKRQRSFNFPETTARKFRLFVDSAYAGPIINELQVYPKEPSRSVVINEFMTQNATTLASPVTGRYEPWFELYNRSETNIDLTGYQLASTRPAHTRYFIPSGFTLPAGGHLLVWGDRQGAATDSSRNQLHTDFALRDGDALALFDPQGDLVDIVDLPYSQRDRAFGSNPDGSNAIAALQFPTPGRRNETIHIESAEKGIDGRIYIQVSSGPFRTFRVERASTLEGKDWKAIRTIISDASGKAQFPEEPASDGLAFYRVAAD